MEGLVSIVTPTFNSEKYISETIKSVQNQTYTNWEMIIVDDCSSDGTTKIVRDIAEIDSRIKLISLAVNSGAGIARSTALKEAKGRFIAFLDSDDLWKPEKLYKQVGFLINENQAFTFSFYECIDENGNSLKKLIKAPQELTYRNLFWSNLVGNLTGIYDSYILGKIEISSIRKRQDWILWLTILKRIKKAKPIPESLAFYRVRENSISSSKWTLVKHNYKIYRDYHRKNVLISVLCIAGFLFTHFFIKPKYIKKLKH